MIAHIFRSRTDLKLTNEEKNIEFNAGKFKFNAGGEGTPMKLLCHKRGDMRKTGKTSTKSSGGIEYSLDRRYSNFRETNEQRVTIIHTRTDKCMGNRGKDWDGDKLSESPKTPKMEIGATSKVEYTISEGNRAIKSHPKSRTDGRKER